MIFSISWGGVFGAVSSRASDHIDGAVSIKNQVADIVDLFAFPTPGQAGQLTLVLDVYPFVGGNGHFSDKVNYNFILRKAVRSKEGPKILTDPDSEVVISCKFISPQQVSGTQMVCASQETQGRVSRVIGQIGFNQVDQPSIGNNIQLFAGRRADPFFLSTKFAGAFLKFQSVGPDSKNVMLNLNCLSIVMNVSLNQLFPQIEYAVSDKSKTRKIAQNESYLVAVAAESVTFDSPGGPSRRIDRIGRPEITNISMNMNAAGGADLRDSYNSDRPFKVSDSKKSVYADRLLKNISGYDNIDGHLDFTPEQLQKLVSVLLDDYLVVDPSMPCPKTSFFEIERAMLLGQPHETCGGRDMNDNVVNKMYTLYEKGLVAMPSVAVTDGLTGPAKPVSTTFPYQAEPYDGLAAVAAEWLANLLKSHL